MALNLTNFADMLKELYTSDHVENMTYKNNPLFAMIAKMESFEGKYLPVPLVYGNPQGRSRDFTQAKKAGARSFTAVDAFNLTRVKNYGIATIDNEVILASKSDAGAFMEAAKTEIDGVIRQLTNDLAAGVYGTGYGDVGVIAAASSVSTTVLTLSDPNTVVNFEVGMELDVSLSVSSNLLKARGSSTNGLIITKVDRQAGTLTFGFNVNDATNGIPTIAVGDVIFLAGDRQDSATPALTKLAGLQSWLPDTVGASDSFFGVNRSTDRTRLGGIVYQGAGAPIEETLLLAAARVAREGGTVTHAFLSTDKYAQLINALGSKVVYTRTGINAVVGFDGVKIQGQNGEFTVYPDRNCPSGKAFLLQLDTWKLYSIGKAVRVIDTDDLQMLRLNDSDGVEVRYGSYSNVGCRAPGWNCVVSL